MSSEEDNIGDKGILSNLMFATGTGSLLFLGYCLVRTLFKGVYSSNLHSYKDLLKLCVMMYALLQG